MYVSSIAGTAVSDAVFLFFLLQFLQCYRLALLVFEVFQYYLAKSSSLFWVSFNASPAGLAAILAISAMQTNANERSQADSVD